MNSVTLRELARHLGLGTSTVQRALSGAIKVKPATRQRVLKAAEEMGYKPDLYFSALAAHRRRKGSGRALVHYFFGSRELEEHGAGISILEVLREQAPAFGLDVEPVNFAEFGDIESIPRILYRRGSRGFIVGLCGTPVQKALGTFSAVPIVCSQRQENLPFHSLCFSITGTVRLCWEKLWSAGYRRIGCAVMRHDSVLLDDLERSGMAEALISAHLPPEQRVPVLRCPFWDVDAYKEWVRKETPEAVICFRNNLEPQTREAAGRVIPYVTLHADDSPTAGCLASQSLLARECLRQMSSLIRMGEIGMPQQPFHLQIEPLWQDGVGLPATRP